MGAEELSSDDPAAITSKSDYITAYPNADFEVTDCLDLQLKRLCCLKFPSFALIDCG